MPLPRRCAYCNAEFTPKRPWGRYCSKRCRWAARPARQRQQEVTLRGVVRTAAKALGMRPEDFA